MPLRLCVTTICNLLCILFKHEIKQPKMAAKKALQIIVMKLALQKRK
jgi:hypothetical protein